MFYFSLLERKYGLCSGIIERDFDKNVDISTMIVEKFQGFVIVRGRYVYFFKIFNL